MRGIGMNHGYSNTICGWLVVFSLSLPTLSYSKNLSTADKIAQKQRSELFTEVNDLLAQATNKSRRSKISEDKITVEFESQRVGQVKTECTNIDWSNDALRQSITFGIIKMDSSRLNCTTQVKGETSQSYENSIPLYDPDDFTVAQRFKLGDKILEIQDISRRGLEIGNTNKFFDSKNAKVGRYTIFGDFIEYQPSEKATIAYINRWLTQNVIGHQLNIVDPDTEKMFVTTNTLGNNYHHVNYYANTPKRKILIQAHTPKIDWSKALPNQSGEYAYLRYDNKQQLKKLVSIFSTQFFIQHDQQCTCGSKSNKIEQTNILRWTVIGNSSSAFDQTEIDKLNRAVTYLVKLSKDS